MVNIGAYGAGQPEKPAVSDELAIENGIAGGAANPEWPANERTRQPFARAVD
jgi:hypothetical protein